MNLINRLIHRKSTSQIVATTDQVVSDQIEKDDEDLDDENNDDEDDDLNEGMELQNIHVKNLDDKNSVEIHSVGSSPKKSVVIEVSLVNKTGGFGEFDILMHDLLNSVD